MTRRRSRDRTSPRATLDEVPPPSRVTDSLRAYALHQRAVGSLFWLPTVFLYLLEQVGLSRALQLGALYYLTVVVVEVPSGWFSDRVGRVVSLRVTAVAWTVTHLLFLLGGTLPIVGAQLLLAVGYAFLSGTDATFHFDTLDGVGRADEFERREAEARRGLLFATAAAAVVGGCLGFVDLRLPFLASLGAAVVQFASTMRMTEPPRRQRRSTVGADLRSVARALRTPVLAWVTLYVVAEVILIHLVAELAPPYISMVLDRPADDPAAAAVIAGVVAAVVAMSGAISLGWVDRARGRFGVAAVLVVLALASAGAVVLMATVTSLVILLAVVTRGVQAAATSVLVPGIVARRVERQHRATVLSVTSLAGRCTYGVVLFALAAAGDGLPVVLDRAALIAVVTAVAALAAARVPAVARGLRTERAEPR